MCSVDVYSLYPVQDSLYEIPICIRHYLSLLFQQFPFPNFIFLFNYYNYVRNYVLEQLYEYVTTMVCVAVRGIPVMGVIHSPFIGQTAWAWVDHSMSEYLSQIHPDRPKVDNPIITVSRSHAGDVKDLTHSVFGENSNILTAAGAGYKVLQVVANNATAYLHSTKIKKWDICAGDAILRALGGKMTTLDNEYIDYGPSESPVNARGLLATIVNHEEYIEKLMDYRKSHKPIAKHR